MQRQTDSQSRSSCLGTRAIKALTVKIIAEALTLAPVVLITGSSLNTTVGAAPGVAAALVISTLEVAELYERSRPTTAQASLPALRISSLTAWGRTLMLKSSVGNTVAFNSSTAF